MTGVRIDKWLWAARFFKTRTLAARACELGRVEINGQRVKPAREVRLHDRLRIQTDGGQFDVEVLGLSEIRGPAAVARTLCHESEESRAQRLKMAEERRLAPGFDAPGGIRPAKRDRRLMERFRGRV